MTNGAGWDGDAARDSPTGILHGKGKSKTSPVLMMPSGAASTLFPATVVSPSCLSSLIHQYFLRGVMLEWKVFYAGVCFPVVVWLGFSSVLGEKHCLVADSLAMTVVEGVRRVGRAATSWCLLW